MFLTKQCALPPDAALSDATDRLPHAGSLVPRVILRRLDLSPSAPPSHSQVRCKQKYKTAVEDEEEEVEEEDDDEELVDAIGTSRCAVVISSGNRGNLRRETCRLETVTMDTSDHDDTDHFVAYRLLPSGGINHDDISNDDNDDVINNINRNNNNDNNNADSGICNDNNNNDCDAMNMSDDVSSGSRLGNIVIVLKKEVSANRRGRKPRGGRKRRKHTFSEEGDEYIKIRRDEERGCTEIKRDEVDDVDEEEDKNKEKVGESLLKDLKTEERNEEVVRRRKVKKEEIYSLVVDGEIEERKKRKLNKKDEKANSLKESKEVERQEEIERRGMIMEDIRESPPREGKDGILKEEDKLREGYEGEMLLNKEEDGEKETMLRREGDDGEKNVLTESEEERENLSRDGVKKDDGNLVLEEEESLGREDEGKAMTLQTDHSKEFLTEQANGGVDVKEEERQEQEEVAPSQGQTKNGSNSWGHIDSQDESQDDNNPPQTLPENLNNTEEEDLDFSNEEEEEAADESRPGDSAQRSDSESLGKILIVKSPERLGFRVVQVGSKGQGRENRDQIRELEKEAETSGGEDDNTTEADRKEIEPDIIPTKPSQLSSPQRDLFVNESSVERFRQESPRQQCPMENESGEQVAMTNEEERLNEDETEEREDETEEREDETEEREEETIEKEEMKEEILEDKEDKECFMEEKENEATVIEREREVEVEENQVQKEGTEAISYDVEEGVMNGGKTVIEKEIQKISEEEDTGEIRSEEEDEELEIICEDESMINRERQEDIGVEKEDKMSKCDNFILDRNEEDILSGIERETQKNNVGEKTEDENDGKEDKDGGIDQEKVEVHGKEQELHIEVEADKSSKEEAVITLRIWDENEERKQKDIEEFRKESKGNKVEEEEIKKNVSEVVIVGGGGGGGGNEQISQSLEAAKKNEKIFRAFEETRERNERIFSPFEGTKDRNKGIFRPISGIKERNIEEEKATERAKEIEILKRLGQSESSLRGMYEISRRPASSHDRRKPAPTFPAWTLPSGYATYPYYANYNPLPPTPPLSTTIPNNAVFGLPTKPPLPPSHTTVFGHNYLAPSSPLPPPPKPPPPAPVPPPPRLQKKSPPPAHSQRPFELPGKMTNQRQLDDIYKQFTIPADNRIASEEVRRGVGGGHKSNIRGGPPRMSIPANTISSSATISSNNSLINNINNNNIMINSDNNTVINKNNNNNNSTPKWYTTPPLQHVHHPHQQQQQQRIQNTSHTSPLIDLRSGEALRVQQAIARRALVQRGERERMLVPDTFSSIGGLYPVSGHSRVGLPTGRSTGLPTSAPSMYSARSPGNICMTTAPTSTSTSGQRFITSSPNNREGVVNLSQAHSNPQGSNNTAQHFIEGLRRHLDARPAAPAWDAAAPAASATLPLDLSRPPRAPIRSHQLQQQDAAMDFSRRTNVATVTSTAPSTVPLLLSQYMYPKLA